MTATVQDTSKKNTKRSLALGSLAGLMALTGAFAFFTDREQANVSATAGTVDLALTADWQDVTRFSPGDKLDLGYEIGNTGNKSIDVRERIIVKADVAMNTADQAEFEIYQAADVSQNASGQFVPQQGAEPIATGADRIVSDDQTAITYELAQYTLNGVGTAAEAEDGINATSNVSDYVLVFKDSSSNKYQGAEITVDLVAEAKQHRNTGDDTWNVITTDSLTVGGGNINVVPGR